MRLCLQGVLLTVIKTGQDSRGKVGGMEQKEGLRITPLPRSGREDYVECVVNGCRERPLGDKRHSKYI